MSMLLAAAAAAGYTPHSGNTAAADQAAACQKKVWDWNAHQEMELEHQPYAAAGEGLDCQRCSAA